MSIESLKDLAQFVRENDVKNDPENIDDFFNSWVYLGEVFRLQAKGAYWTVGAENPKNLNYGLEYLTGYNTIGSEFIPLLIMNSFTLSKRILFKVVKSFQSFLFPLKIFQQGK
ncbi:hypothetical protein [Streptococcus sanguinis]|uniref:hypothetical protein n=1 Tax=Streptococcus sanguinis TaxID=1305 RepID=UPI001CBC3D50|nr:hypothetical protein [Streptococcus sanguinis]